MPFSSAQNLIVRSDIFHIEFVQQLRMLWKYRFRKSGRFPRRLGQGPLVRLLKQIV